MKQKHRVARTFIVVRGLPGSGKSTFADMIAMLGNGVVYSTDDYWTAERPFQASLLREAHQWNRERAYKAFRNGVPLVVLANTSSREWEFQDYIYEAENYNYKVYSLIMENRHKGETVHNVPESTILGMERSFELKLHKSTKVLQPPTFWGNIKQWLRRHLTWK